MRNRSRRSGSERSAGLALRALGVGLAVLGASVLAVGPGLAAAQELPTEPGPAQSTAAGAKMVGEDDYSMAPPGANLPGCQPSTDHPNPVLLVHGSDSTAYLDWAGLAPRLHQRGICVYAVNYGHVEGKGNAQTPVEASGAQLAGLVDQVRAQTGAAKVDLLGFSQGAAVTRYYVNMLGGSAHVDQWVGLASPTYGSTFYGVGAALAGVPGSADVMGWALGPALPQLISGSQFLAALNGNGDTRSGARYTTITTRFDEMIQPHTNQFLRDPGATNLLIQDLCAANMIGHMNLPYDRFTQDLIIAVLDPSSPAPKCERVPLGTGILELMIASNS